MTEARFLSYDEATRLLAPYDLPLAPARVVQNPEEAVAAAQTLGLPVALKALVPDLTHKSDVGLVTLNLADEDAVMGAAEALLTATEDDEREGLLVQAMVPAGVEVIAGISTDPQFGPVLAFGSGGILVELLDDVILRLPPLSRAQAERMICETRASRLLQGYRNVPPADVAALVDLLVNLGRLALAEAERLVSLDLNPVIVRSAGQGAQIVDLRVAVRPEREDGA